MLSGRDRAETLTGAEVDEFDDTQEGVELGEGGRVGAGRLGGVCVRQCDQVMSCDVPNPEPAHGVVEAGQQEAAVIGELQGARSEVVRLMCEELSGATIPDADLVVALGRDGHGHPR